MSFNKVVIAGSGVLGSQIAFQTAYKGFEVTVYDISEEILDQAKSTIEGLGKQYEAEITSKPEDIKTTLNHLSYTDDLKKSVGNADLVIEAIPEKLSLKESFYQELSKAAPEKVVFANNSSTLLPSEIAPYTDRPQKFCNLHFANHIWINNTAEVMGSDQTDTEVYEQLVEFAKEIGMVPIQLKKEQSGYVLNSLLIPLLNAASDLWANEIADPQTIDKTWMIGTGAPMGPFGIMDVVGLQTVYNINDTKAKATNDPMLEKISKKVKDMLDQGQLGTKSGQGFYTYPDPEFKKENFLKS